MNNAVILLGSNEGGREENISLALRYLNEDAGAIVKRSSLYETAPWGNINQPAFLNMAIEIETGISAFQLMNILLETEKKMGRIRNVKWEQRLIDLDIIFFNNECISSAGLQIPHPHMHERCFVLTPLAEIIPDHIHPVFKKSVMQLLRETQDHSAVWIYDKSIVTDNIFSRSK